jgi:MFS family permease
MFQDGGMAIRGLIRALPSRTEASDTGAGLRLAVALALVSVAQFLVALDYSIVYLALPSITTDLRIVPALAQWVVSGYSVMFAGFLIVGGRLADRSGPVRMYIIAMLLFGLASGAGALAGDAAVLMAGFFIAAAGLVLLSVTLRGGAYVPDLLPGLLLSGFGHGMIYTATFIIGSRDVPAVHQGTAGALLTTAQYLSGAITIAVLTVVLEHVRGYPGFTGAFVLLAVAAGAGSLLGVRHRLGRSVSRGG